MGANAISMYRGDSNFLECVVKSQTSAGVMGLVNVTGASAKLSVKQKRNSTAYVLQVDGDVEDGTAGELSFTLDPSDTQSLLPGVYVYDVQVTLLGGAVYTIALDTFELKEDLTRPA